MDFRIDATLPATAAQLWAIFFDVQRVATLIPGCENVTELEPFKEFSAVMKQKIGPFRLEVPTRIVVESQTPERQVVLVANGSDKLTGTTLDVRLEVELAEQRGPGGVECKLGVAAAMQVNGRLASLGYPIVKKRSEELFAEFERRLRAELTGVGGLPSREAIAAPAMPARHSVPLATSTDAQVPSQPLPAPAKSAAQPAARLPERARRTELVFVWPRAGISLAVGIAVAHGAVAFGQSPWWWLVAPLLGAAAGLDRRAD